MEAVSGTTALPMNPGKPAAANGEVSKTPAERYAAVKATATVGAVDQTVSISTLAGRLSMAALNTSERLQGLDHVALQSQLNADVKNILYNLDTAHKAVAAKQTPQPNDAVSAKSAAAATAFVAGSAPIHLPAYRASNCRRSRTMKAGPLR
jgi:hypothetical protein